MANKRYSYAELTPELLRRLLEYNADTGYLIWKSRGGEGKIKGWDKKHAGKVAGCKDNLGYIYFTVYSRRMAAHRAAWAVHYGETPPDEIDHVDGNPSNNAISNLRKADRFKNNQNTKMKDTNTSGFKGVSWSKHTKRWRSEIIANGERYHLGYFEDKDHAKIAYVTAAKLLHGQFARVEQ